MGALVPLDAPRCALGEGAAYDSESGALTWVDIPASQTYGWIGSLRTDKAAFETAFTFRLTDGSVIEGGAKGLVAGGRTLVPPGLRADVEALNDGAVHPSGRMAVIGSRHREESAPMGHAWVLWPAGWAQMERRFTVFNGPVFSLDGAWLYYADSNARTIYRRAVDIDRQSLGPEAVFARVPEEAGLPDGAAVDDAGHLWSAHWDGARLTRYRPDGSVERVVPLPVARATSLAFFGPDRDRIAVTTAFSDGVDPAGLAESDLSGRVLIFSAGITGPARPRLDAGLIHRLTGENDVQTLP